MESLEQQKKDLEARKQKQHFEDSYLSDDPDGSGQAHSNKMWAEIFAIEAALTQEELKQVKQKLEIPQPGTIRPITLDEVTKHKEKVIPSEVIESFNELIAANWSGSYSQFKQKDILRLISKKLKLRHSTIFDRGYLDIEPIYEAKGWSVTYDKPCRNETYEPTFKFSKK